MRSGNEKPAGNTWCIGKGFEAAWAFFCPSKPYVSLSLDGKNVKCCAAYCKGSQHVVYCARVRDTTDSDTVPSRAAHIRFIGLLAMNINFMEENKK